MSDRAPRARKGSESTDSLEEEARRFLGTPMQDAMIRGLNDKERIQAYLAVAREMMNDGELARGKYEKICERMECVTEE